MRQIHAHADITEPWRQKTPAENNNPKEEREEVKQTNPTNPPTPTQRENRRHYTYITAPHKIPPPPNTHPTKEIHTPSFIDPLRIPLDTYLWHITQ